jgi:hypothetical protein
MRKATGFRHPVDIRSNEKIAALIGEHGPAGYGVYWMIIEMLHREEGMRIEYSEKRIRRMQAQTGMDREAFRRLLQDLIDIYDLLAVEEGHLVSAISYRRRSRPKQQSAPQPATEAPPAAPPQPAAEVPPAEQEHSPEELQFHEELKSYIAWRTPAISRMLQPLTVAQSLHLRHTYDEATFFHALDQVQNTPALRLPGTPAYDALMKVLEETAAVT